MPRLYRRPIDQLVSLAPSGPSRGQGWLISGRASRLDAFSGYPFRTWLPGVLPLARQPVHQRSVHLGPLVLKAGPLSHPSNAADRDRTVSRRSEPSSRTALDVNSWARSACYPRSTFYPLSDGASTRYRQITKTHFRACSECPPCSQAALCLCACRTIPNRPKATFARLRYHLGGDRPSQTPRLALSRCRITAPVRKLDSEGWYFTVGSAHPDGHASLPPTYPTHPGPASSTGLE